MVLSTFHTNDAPSAITRFHHMGVESYLLASTLNLIIAQRLVKRICKNCKTEAQFDPRLLQRLKMDSQSTLYRGTGCGNCGGSGYFGRLPIFEFFPINSEIRNAIASGSSESKLRAMARKQGYGGLLESGVSKVLQGDTTPEEVVNVTFEEEMNV